jgi:hypothetical protein
MLDALIGDATLFIRSDEVEQCWRIVDPIIKHWEDHPDRIPFYEAASWGPFEADQLLTRDGRAWHNNQSQPDFGTRSRATIGAFAAIGVNAERNGADPR